MPRYDTPRAPTSALCTQVAFQGVPHYHSLEIRDRFGNLLDGYPTDGGFTATLIGTPDARAGVTQEQTPHVTIATTVSEGTDASGKLSVNFTPEIAGTYVMSNEFTGPGGLLATFFRTKDFLDPVHENSAYATEVKHLIQASSPYRVENSFGTVFRNFVLCSALVHRSLPTSCINKSFSC